MEVSRESIIPNAAPSQRLKAVTQPHLLLTEDQLRSLERAREEKEAHGQIETAHPGYLGAQDTYYVGTIKSVIAVRTQLNQCGPKPIRNAAERQDNSLSLPCRAAEPNRSFVLQQALCAAHRCCCIKVSGCCAGWGRMQPDIHDETVGIRRHGARVRGKGELELRFHPTNVVVRAEVVGASQRGFRIRYCNSPPLEVGVRVRVTYPWGKVHANVVWCHAVGEWWEAGFSLVRDDSD